MKECKLIMKTWNAVLRAVTIGIVFIPDPFLKTSSLPIGMIVLMENMKLCTNLRKKGKKRKKGRREKRGRRKKKEEKRRLVCI